jgi:hypothetical protein
MAALSAGSGGGIWHPGGVFEWRKRRRKRKGGGFKGEALRPLLIRIVWEGGDRAREFRPGVEELDRLGRGVRERERARGLAAGLVRWLGWFGPGLAQLAACLLFSNPFLFYFLICL